MRIPCALTLWSANLRKKHKVLQTLLRLAQVIWAATVMHSQETASAIASNAAEILGLPYQ